MIITLSSTQLAMPVLVRTVTTTFRQYIYETFESRQDMSLPTFCFMIDIEVFNIFKALT
jgi:hypothetical protein